MKKLILSFVLFSSFTALHAANCVIVQNGSRVGVYSTITAAITASLSGDTIYIAGSTAAYAESITINKPLTIFGAGWLTSNTQMTGPTIISGSITISNGASDLSISGIQIQSIIFNNTLDLSNVSITRCYIPGRIYATASTYFKMINFKVSECFLDGGQQFNFLKCTSKCSIEKNFFSNSYVSQISGNTNYDCRFINNIFFKSNNWTVNAYATSGSYIGYHAFIYQTYDCAFMNNIFLHNMSDYATAYLSFYYLEASSDRNVLYNNFYNCRSGGQFGASDFLTANIYQPSWTPTNVFTSFSSWANWTTCNFHVSDASGLKKAGSDSLQLGIYGSATPFKDGFLPRNPHIEAISVSTETDANGLITITAKTAAQAR